MGRHRPTHHLNRWLGTALAATLLVVTVPLVWGRGATGLGRWAEPPASPCARTVRVLTSTSFAPVLDTLSPTLARGDDCVRLDVQVLDGRAAAGRVGQVDVWIPDDVSWAATARGTRFAPAGTAGAQTVLATSPIFMVAGRAAADRIDAEGGTWTGLAKLLAAEADTRLAVRDPAGSGDGLVAVGDVGEAVWIDQGMDASALALAKVRRVTRAAPGVADTLPATPDEVGLIPEYAMVPVLDQVGGDSRILPGTDRTALLRFPWLPTADAVDDPVRAAGLDRLYQALTGPDSAPAITRAHLRPANEPAPGQPQVLAGDPGAPPGEPPGIPGGPGGSALPATTAAPFDVLGDHHVDHVFATWYSGDRQANLLIVTDVSGSMAEPADGTGTSRIELVRQGCRTLGELLPDEAQVGLWEFGAELDPPRDYRVVLPAGPLTASHREAWSRALDGLAARRTGTGLYDTLAAAYESARDNYQPDVPNQVLLFTDGRNEDKKESTTLQQLSQRLAAAKDPQRPIQVTVVTLGATVETGRLKEAVKTVDGYVDPLRTPAEVEAAFIHVTAGGLHGP